MLVVCDPHVLIFSVKYSEYRETENPQVGANRWLRETVEHSVKGIYGAERNLARATHVTRSDGQQGLPLPRLADRKVHRISVSLGGRRLINFSSGDFGKGFVHCFDDQFVVAALGELDTVTDFIAYLEAKEDILQQRRLVMLGGEEDLLAVYLHRGRKFPEAADRIMVEADLWTSFLRNAAYQRRLEAERPSYAWDGLIEYVAEYALAGQMESGGTLSDNERVLRVMARETRLSRRMLAGAFLEFRERAKRREASARMVPSLSGVTYVFYDPPPTNERAIRKQVLERRCFVARNQFRENKTVIGIGLNVEPAPEGYAVDLVFLHFPNWPAECEREAEKIKQELGYFRTMQMTNEQIDEYPDA